MTLENMVKVYKENAAAHRYIVGFQKLGQVWVIELTSEQMFNFVVADVASKGQGTTFKFRPKAAQKDMLIAMGAARLVPSSLFDSLVKSSRYNRGEIFEKLITEKAGQSWEKDHVPFNEGADIEINGIGYQIKFEKASFATEKTLQRLANK